MNVDTPCPQCGTVFTVRRELLGKRTKCTRCGTVFTIAEVAAPAASPQPPMPNVMGLAGAEPPPTSNYFPEITTPPPNIPLTPQIHIDPTPRASHHPAPSPEPFGFDAGQPSFSILRLMARGYEILAIFVFAFALVALLVLAFAIIRNPENLIAALMNGASIFFSSMLVALSLSVFAQAIRLALQIEQNTRQTHQACRQLADHLGAIEVER